MMMMSILTIVRGKSDVVVVMVITIIYIVFFSIMVQNPIKVGLLFPPKLDKPNAPTAEEYKSGAVSRLIYHHLMVSFVHHHHISNNTRVPGPFLFAMSVIR